MPGQWAGANERERQRAEALYRSRGANKVLELARNLALPQDIVVRTPAYLGEYDIERKQFPFAEREIAFLGGAGFVVDPHDLSQRPGLATLMPAGAPVIGSVAVRWRNPVRPPYYQVPETEAEAIATSASAPAVFAHYGRDIYIATSARLHSLNMGDDGSQVFDAEVLEVKLYWDLDLQSEFASLPVARR